MMYTLYLKTHNITGKKYLGKTKKDPYTYNGSGVDWIEHLREHGDDISTDVLYRTSDKKKLKSQGKYYSALYDIVRSPDFLNKKVESGDGGGTPWTEERRQFHVDLLSSLVWITNGQDERRVSPEETIPEGWRQGRKGWTCTKKYKQPTGSDTYYIHGIPYRYNDAKELQRRSTRNP